ncbi:hypothetical protein N657DRAFT_642347 [Parathielavia appendiculata]|uniref:Uncharacterized protein n=1 Tax=Parathielavia appendiculata TaxID=2587402 RepID=A0AAN6Z646_9PEZI|nr:hypothetical protein N657DRAFT_642347 [Parathielavia appendiculata]
MWIKANFGTDPTKSFKYDPSQYGERQWPRPGLCNVPWIYKDPGLCTAWTHSALEIPTRNGSSYP